MASIISKSLLQKLENCFDKNSTKFTPYIININVSMRSGFILEYIENKVALWKKVGNSYFQLYWGAIDVDYSDLSDSVTLDIEYDPTKNTVNLMIRGTQVLTYTDAAFTKPPNKIIRRCYELSKNLDTIRNLKSASKRLLTHDKFISSRYSLENISESQALEVKELSDNIFTLANNIVLINET
ncbi:MAG: hypothetical protein QM730_19000 [Anaerolineales bacterium]